MTVQVTITPNGRMSLPAAIRKRLGLEGGGAVLVEETPDGVVLRTLDQAVARAQAIAKRYSGHPDASVDAFLAGRRADSGE
jgi:AbrB family looped-hinge helix DNA binding protein